MLNNVRLTLPARFKKGLFTASKSPFWPTQPLIGSIRTSGRVDRTVPVVGETRFPAPTPQPPSNTFYIQENTLQFFSRLKNHIFKPHRTSSALVLAFLVHRFRVFFKIQRPDVPNHVGLQKKTSKLFGGGFQTLCQASLVNSLERLLSVIFLSQHCVAERKKSSASSIRCVDENSHGVFSQIFTNATNSWPRFLRPMWHTEKSPFL